MHRRERDPLAPAEKLAYSINEAAALTGIKRTTLQRLLDNGALATVHVGRRRVVLADSLMSFLERQAVSRALLDPRAYRNAEFYGRSKP